MCHAVLCRTCGKVTWAGCGLHVDQALAGFPKDELCEGHEHGPPHPDTGWLGRLRPRG